MHKLVSNAARNGLTVTGDDPQQSKDDTTLVDPAFYNYAREFYRYRYEFYIRSSNPGSIDGDTRADLKVKIYHMLAFGKILAPQKHNDQRPTECIRFTFNCDYSLPLHQVAKQLKDFEKIVLNTYHIDDRLHPNLDRLYLRDYIRDAKGNIDYFKAKGGDSFSLWGKYLTAYDLYNCVKSFREVGLDLYYDPDKSNEKAAYKQAERDVEQAKLLIDKSSLYTFPH